MEQGSFEKLSAKSSLEIAIQPSSHSVDDGPAEKPNAVTKSTTADEEEKLMDLTRQTGDMTVYKYWFRHFGWTPALVYLSFQILAAFTISFPRMPCYSTLPLLANASQRCGSNSGPIMAAQSVPNT